MNVCASDGSQSHQEGKVHATYHTLHHIHIQIIYFCYSLFLMAQRVARDGCGLMCVCASHARWGSSDGGMHTSTWQGVLQHVLRTT